VFFPFSPQRDAPLTTTAREVSAITARRLSHSAPQRLLDSLPGADPLPSSRPRSRCAVGPAPFFCKFCYPTLREEALPARRTSSVAHVSRRSLRAPFYAACPTPLYYPQQDKLGCCSFRGHVVPLDGGAFLRLLGGTRVYFPLPSTHVPLAAYFL